MSRTFKPLMFALAVAGALSSAPAHAGPTLTFGNSPGGYPGTLVFGGGATPLATGVPIDLFGDGLPSLGFAMTTANASGGWTFPSGGSVAMTVGGGSAALPSGTVLFTGQLGLTTIALSPELPGSITGYKWAVRGTFTTSDLDDAYETSLGLGLAANTVYDGDFWFGFNDPTDGNARPMEMVVGQAFDRQVGWRQIHLVARDARTSGQTPEPPVLAALAAGMLALAARRQRARRTQKA